MSDAKIKTFPLQFTEDRLDEIRKAAADAGVSIKDFILSAISDKMAQLEKGE